MLFDTNVWLLLNGPFPDIHDRRYRAYSWLYKAALEAGAEVFMPQIVMCEFARIFLHIRAESDGWDKADKIHRFNGYKDLMRDAADELHHMLSACTRTPDGFDKAKIDELFAEAGELGVDFNDAIIGRICQDLDLVLVTDDADFSGSSAVIVTANPKLAGQN